MGIDGWEEYTRTFIWHSYGFSEDRTDQIILELLHTSPCNVLLDRFTSLVHSFRMLLVSY
jgi:hypothetical protein